MPRQDFLLKQIEQIGIVLRQLLGKIIDDNNIQLIENYLQEAQNEETDEIRKEVARLLNLSPEDLSDSAQDKTIQAESCTDLIHFYLTLLEQNLFSSENQPRDFLAKMEALSPYANLTLAQILLISEWNRKLGESKSDV